jgi:tetratricopeptide (TPR) repeat protein
MHSLFKSTLFILALGFSNTAWLQEDDRKSREERRALKMSDVNNQTTMSEAYRQAAHEKRLESINRAKDMLKGGQLSGEAKAKVQFRLAEMYFEEGRFYYFNEMQNYQNIYDDCFNGIPKGCDVNKMSPDNGKSQKWQKNAIRLYDDILRNYPQYQRADQVLFFLGSAYQEINEPDKAKTQFVRLTKEYSNSQYVAAAWVQIGEYFFDRNKAYDALTAYAQAAKDKDSPNYGFAVYKLSWCYYNVGEYDQAIEGMKTVVRYSQVQQQSAGEKSSLMLQDEALKDLVRFFADAGDMQEAETYFRSLGKEDLYNKMLKRLAKMYFEQGKFSQSITTYRKLIAENSDSPYAPNYQNEIINSYQRMNEKEQTLNEIQKLLQNYGKNSTWAAKNSANPDAVRKAQNFVEDALRRVAVNYNNEAKKLGAGKQAQSTYLLAEKAYRVYLQEFPNGKNSYDMEYAFAELIYNLAEKGRFDAETKEKYFTEAFESYMKVVAIDKKGKYSEFCAEASIFAADELIGYDKKKGLVKDRKKDTDIDPIEMSPWEAKKLIALDQYADLYPNNKNAISHLYTSARLLFDKNLLDEASSRFRTVISMNPKSKQAMFSANLILGALDKFAQAKEEKGDFAGAAKDFAALRDTAQAFEKQEGLGNSSFKKEMTQIYEASAIKEIEVVYNASPKADPDKRTAADSYMAFVRAHTTANKSDVAVNIAAVYYYELQDSRMMMDARQFLIDNYPKSTKYTENVARLGFAYETIAKFQAASEWYEKLFSIDKDFDMSKDALHRASIFRESLGQYDKAIDNKKLYMKAYPDDERVIGYTFDIANIIKKKGDLAGASKAFYTYFTKEAKASEYSKFLARYEYGELSKKLDKDVSKHWVNTLKAYDKMDEATRNALTPEELKAIRQIVEEVKYDLAIEATRDYFEIEITGPGAGRANPKYIKSVLNKQITKKQQALKDLETQFTEVAQMVAGKYTIAAIVELGKAYENYGNTIKDSYIPSFLDEDQQDLYRMQLEDQAYPYYENATVTYQKALEFAFQFNLYTDASADATRRLGELRPDEYPELTEMLPSAEFLTEKTSTRTYLQTAE